MSFYQDYMAGTLTKESIKQLPAEAETLAIPEVDVVHSVKSLRGAPSDTPLKLSGKPNDGGLRYVRSWRVEKET